MNVNSAFKILHVSEAATFDEINASYRRLLKEYHPDKNREHSEWSHRMTIRLTEAFKAVSAHLREKPEQEKPEKIIPDTAAEPDSGYSLAMQARIAALYDTLLEHLYKYYSEGMDNLYLREEGTLRQHYRLTLRRLEQTIHDFRGTHEWPGSAHQHHQVKIITDFATSFYENMLIKPREQEAGNNLKAEKLYEDGTLALDTSIKRGILTLEHIQGLICPAARYRAEQNFILLLTTYYDSPYVSDTLVKLLLLKAFSALCEQLEISL